jgi:beta-galactosidase
VARGGDGILFFQWRASRAGAEKFHSGLVPHAGTDTRVWREVCDLGALLDRLDEVAGARSDNRVALLFDWHARWAAELDSHPSTDVNYLAEVREWHRALTAQGIGVDVVHPGADLSAYAVVVVPTLYLVTDEHAAAVAAVAERGAHVVVTSFSGIVDEHDHVRLGGYPGAFRDLLGVLAEEFTPLREGETVRLDDGSTGSVWAEDLRLTGAEAVASYVDGPVPGAPAVTRNAAGRGVAWYVATHLDPAGVDALAARIVAEAGVEPVAASRPGVEVLRRVSDDRSWVFVLNHTAEEVSLTLDGHDLVSGASVTGTLRVAGGDVAVVREG